MKALLPGILFLALFCGCHKKQQFRNYLPQGLKDYFNWQDGSYWVFANSRTGYADSFVVTKYLPGTDYQYSDRHSNDYAYEVLKISMKEYYGAKKDSSTDWTLELSSLGDLYVSSLSSNTFTHEDEFTEGWPFSVAGSGKKNVEKKYVPAARVNGKDYYSVYSYAVVYDLFHKDEILMNADSGFVKINLDNGNSHQTLELERSKIIR